MDEAPAWRKNVGTASRSLYPTMSKLPQVYPMSGSLGPYELICELGSGGMGTVYAARRCYEGNITRTVVVKTLRSDLYQRKDLVELFLNEARIIAKLHHRSVCAVTDVGVVDGIPYVAMEYLIGEPLSRLIPLMAKARGETSVAATTRIIADLCEGLHAAHELKDSDGKVLGLVHRDISPDNLFVQYDGTVRLMDFGIALTTELQNSGKGGGLAGKCAYMSPQQLRCERLDRRTDIWSMGVVLWEMLTGKRLFFRASDVRTASAALTLEIPAPSTHNELIPPNLDAVVKRALCRDLDQRYDNARELANALHSVLSTTLVPMSAAKVGKFVDGLFPGRKDFWHKIVVHSREVVQDSGPVSVPPDLFGTSGLEFDPMAQGVPDVRILALANPESEPGTFDPAAELGNKAAAVPLRDDVFPAPAANEPAQPIQDTRPQERAPANATHDSDERRRAIRSLAKWFLAPLVIAGLVLLMHRSLSSRRVSGGDKPVATAAPTPVRTQAKPAADSPARAPEPTAQQPTLPSPAPLTGTEPTVTPTEPVESAPPSASDDDAQRPKRKAPAQGSVRLTTARADVFVLVSGTPVRIPTVLKLPIGKHTLTILPGRDQARRLEVTVTPNHPKAILVD